MNKWHSLSFSLSLSFLYVSVVCVPFDLRVALAVTFLKVPWMAAITQESTLSISLFSRSEKGFYYLPPIFRSLVIGERVTRGVVENLTFDFAFIYSSFVFRRGLLPVFPGSSIVFHSYFYSDYSSLLCCFHCYFLPIIPCFSGIFRPETSPFLPPRDFPSVSSSFFRDFLRSSITGRWMRQLFGCVAGSKVPVREKKNSQGHRGFFARASSSEKARQFGWWRRGGGIVHRLVRPGSSQRCMDERPSRRTSEGDDSFLHSWRVP